MPPLSATTHQPPPPRQLLDVSDLFLDTLACELQVELFMPGVNMVVQCAPHIHLPLPAGQPLAETTAVWFRPALPRVFDR